MQIDDCATKELTELFSKPKKTGINPGKERIFAFKQDHGGSPIESLSKDFEGFNIEEEVESPHLGLKKARTDTNEKHFEIRNLFSDGKRGFKNEVKSILVNSK